MYVYSIHRIDVWLYENSKFAIIIPYDWEGVSLFSPTSSVAY